MLYKMQERRPGQLRLRYPERLREGEPELQGFRSSIGRETHHRLMIAFRATQYGPEGLHPKCFPQFVRVSHCPKVAATRRNSVTCALPGPLLHFRLAVDGLWVLGKEKTRQR